MTMRDFVRGRMAGKTRHMTRTALRGRMPKELLGDWKIGDFVAFTDPDTGLEAVGRIMQFTREHGVPSVQVSVMALNDGKWEHVPHDVEHGRDRVHNFTTVMIDDLTPISYREYLKLLDRKYPDAFASVRHVAFTEDEAREVGEAIGINWNDVDFDPKDLADGMKVELEHGTKVDERVNITDDDAEMTAEIAWAHLMEDPDYYIMLDEMEGEFDGERTPELRKEGRMQCEAATGMWLPDNLDESERALVSHVGKGVQWDINAAMAFCVALLEDVNAHPEAKAVNDLLLSFE